MVGAETLAKSGAPSFMEVSTIDGRGQVLNTAFHYFPRQQVGPETEQPGLQAL